MGPKSNERCHKRKAGWGWGSSSLVVQWLGLGAFSAMARVQSLVRELRFHKWGEGCGKMEAEAGGVQPQAKERLEIPELEEAGRTLPWSLWRERGPAHTLILDF